MALTSKKFRLLTLAAIFVACLLLLHIATGLFDYIPRLRAQAKSPDGLLTIRVYQKRLMPRPFFPRMGAVAKIFDVNGNLIHEDIFFRDSDFDDTLDDAFKQIVFEGDEIVIGPGFYDRRLVYIIRRSDLTGHYRPVPAI